MCVSALSAELTGTYVCTVADVPHPQHAGKTCHATFYQNSVTGGSIGVPPHSGPAGNAMLFAFPTLVPMGPGNLVSADGCENILKDMKRALAPPTRAHNKGFSFGTDTAFQVVNHDIYDVILTNDPCAIGIALQQVEPRKRPPLTPDVEAIYHSFGGNYGAAYFALCCFDDREAGEAKPLVFWYEPAYPDVLVAPALDAHNGKPPQIGADVDVDHWVFFSSAKLAKAGGGVEISYSATPSPALAPLLPARVIGKHYTGRMPNGDFAVTREAVDRAEAFTKNQVHRTLVRV